MSMQWSARLVSCVAIGAMALTVSVDADTIVLKREASLGPDAESVTLGAIAELDGPEAKRFANLTVAQRPQQKQAAMTVTVDDVRAALDQAGAHWGRIDLNGWKTDVQLLIADAEPPLAMTGVSLQAQPPSQRDAGSKPELVGAQQLTAQSNVRGVIARTLAKQLQVNPADLRLEFDPRDDAVLELSMQQYRIELEPMSSLHSDTVRLQVRAWSNSEIVHRATLPIGVQVRINAPVLTAAVRRGDAIQSSDVTPKALWLGAGELDGLMDPASAAGRIATQTLEAGEVLRERDVRRKTLIERGDIVRVRCLVGGVVIAMQAEARDDGSKDDTIEFRKLGERQTFRAKVVSRSEAVIELDR